MSTAKNMMGGSLSALAAQAVNGVVTAAFAASGGGAQLGPTLPSDFVIVTSASSSFSFQMPTAAAQNPSVGDEYTIVNYSSQTLLASTTATGKINNGSAGATYAFANGLTLTARYLGSDNWAMQKGA